MLRSLSQNVFRKAVYGPYRSSVKNITTVNKVGTRRGGIWLLVLGTTAGSGYYVYRQVYVETDLAKDWQVSVYKSLPLNVLSRVWGKMNNVELPVSMREPILSWYIKTFGVNFEEVAIKDLKHYRNLGEFFRRRIGMNHRPIDKTHSLVSPCDGRVLHFGTVDSGLVEQVKGVTYSLQEFLGPGNWPSFANGYTYNRLHKNSKASVDESGSGRQVIETNSLKSYEQHLKVHGTEETALFHCVIYLAPGDYHGFHSPAEWVVSIRRHFPGALLSVNPGVAWRLRGLFCLNERAAYIGEWQYGLMAMVPVGATNVGSIRVFFDEKLHTNQSVRFAEGSYIDQVFLQQGLGGVALKKGEPVGEFNLGSTVVLVFEAPKSFHFALEKNQVIKMGQPIGCASDKTQHLHTWPMTAPPSSEEDALIDVM